MIEIAILLSFLAAQVAFAKLGEKSEQIRQEGAHGKHYGMMIWLLHPHVLHAGHDAVVYAVTLLH